MRVRVEACSNGQGKYHFRCDILTGRYKGERVLVGFNTDGDPWCREYAKQLRDVLTKYGAVKRNSIRVV